MKRIERGLEAERSFDHFSDNRDSPGPDFLVFISQKYIDGKMDVKTHFPVEAEVHQVSELDFIRVIILSFALEKDQFYLLKEGSQLGHIWNDVIRIDIRGGPQSEWKHSFVTFLKKVVSHSGT